LENGAVDQPTETRARRVARYALGIVYSAAGVIHLAKPAPFAAITPAWVPHPETVVALTGVAELFGAIGVLQPFSVPLRRAAGWGLALYALCVWPANYHHMQMDMLRPDHGLGLGYHIPRLLAQPLIIWWALWVSGAVRTARREKMPHR
jgi:uncharacterized membrane protein